ncbi:MAG: DUF502 domain-containing protein [Gammaproteobacteria bacterium]|nr:DUF502 domain-containing protein [Gammaproteobacteria bacterium]
MRKYFIAGLLVWLPVGATILVIKLLVDTMDQTLLLLPPEWRPAEFIGFNVPGLGIALSVLVVFATGVIFANFLGRRLVTFWEALLARIPLVRTVYTAVKQVTETVFSSSSQSFRQVLLVEYPRRGIWSLGFQTNTGLGEVQQKTGEEVVAVFVPTTPNPTSGFVLMIPRKEVVEMDMSVDEGLKMIVSMGVVVPTWPKGDPKAVAPQVSRS